MKIFGLLAALGVALLFGAPAHAAQHSLITHCNLAPGYEPIAFCGAQTGSGGTGNTPACALGAVNYPSCADAVACNFYVAPSDGNDNNNGSAAAPFATLAHLQTVLRSQPIGSKVGCLKAGTYHTTLSPISTDNNEVWQFDPASGSNTAIVDAGSAGINLHFNTVNTFKWNGIRLTNCSPRCIDTAGRNNAITIENTEIDHNSNASGGALQFCAVCMYNTTNADLNHDYAHDTEGPGLALSAWGSGESMDGSKVRNSVSLSACTGLSDCGALYSNAFNTGVSGGAVTFSNNFVRDYQDHTNDVVCIYFDDKTSNSIASGNVCGPPSGMSTSGRNNAGAWLMNDDSFNGTSPSLTQNSSFKNNIVDLGSSGLFMAALMGGTNTTFSHNIIIENFTSINTCASSTCGDIFVWSSSDTGMSITTNAYANFASSTIFQAGSPSGDSSPQNYTTGQLACGGYLYTLASNSAPLGVPVNFVPIVGNFGPLGEPTPFVVPSNSNHSCP